MSTPDDKKERQRSKKALIAELRVDISKSGVFLEEKEKKNINSCASELESVLLEYFYKAKKLNGGSPFSSPKKKKKGRSTACVSEASSGELPHTHSEIEEGERGGEEVCTGAEVGEGGGERSLMDRGNIKSLVLGTEAGREEKKEGGGEGEGEGGSRDVGDVYRRGEERREGGRSGEGGSRDVGDVYRRREERREGGRSGEGERGSNDVGGNREGSFSRLQATLSDGGEQGKRREDREGWQTSHPDSLRDEVKSLQAQLKILKSEVDETQQRNRKGCIIVSSPTSKKGERIESLFEPLRPTAESNQVESGHDDSRKDVEDLDTILSLVEKKYDVKIPVEAITASHWLPTGDYLIKFCNRKPGSYWRKLTSAMRKGGRKGVNLFCNFNLTKPRLALLKCVRQLKSEKKIQQFKVDENGMLSIRLNTQDNSFGQWMKVTQYYSKTGALVHQKTAQELIDLVTPK